MIKVFINGQWTFRESEDLQIGAESFAFESGLYETFRTINYMPVLLGPHLDRLIQTAQKIRLVLNYSRSEIINMVLTVIRDYALADQRVRIIAVPGFMIIYSSALNLDNRIYAGVKVLGVEALRKTPEIKTTDYFTCLQAWKQADALNCFDAFLIDKNGLVYEGTRSNVFWVIHGKLYTREKAVLPGITRQSILTQSPFHVDYGLLNKSEFLDISELFLTNSGSGVVPVVKIDRITIGSGKVGKITMTLIEWYNEWIKTADEHKHGKYYTRD